MFRRGYSDTHNSVKRKDSWLLQKLLVSSLWVARIYIFSGIGALAAYSFFASLDSGGDIAILLQWTGAKILGIIYLLTVQSILPSRALKHKITPGGASLNPSRPSIVLPIVDVVFLAMLTTVGSYATLLGTYFGSPVALCGYVFTIIQIIASVCLIIFRVMVIRESNRKCLFAPFYDDFDPDGPRVQPQILTLIPGRTSGFRGEHALIIFLRVLTLIVFMCGIVSFAVYVTIVEPSGMDNNAAEMNIQASQQSKYLLPEGLSVYVILSSEQASTDILEQAVNVTVLLPPDIPVLSSNCNTDPTTTSIMFSCFGDAIITIDFSALSTNSSPAYVYVGAYDVEGGTTPADRTKVMNQNAMPFPLNPGAHYSAYAKLELREVDVSAGRWFLGMFSSSQTYNIGNIFRYFPDTSPPVSENNISNTATLRLTWPSNTVFPTITVVSDSNDKTVLKGLSSVGGLIASLSGIFALLFGGSLAYHILGSKPLGIFGLLHIGQKRRLIELNDIPNPSTSLEKFLGHFFVDFAQDARGGQVDQDLSRTQNLSDTSEEDETAALKRSEEGIRMSRIG